MGGLFNFLLIILIFMYHYTELSFSIDFNNLLK